ncbi:MAG: 7TM-DISM domain-containing protein, partial [Candidatus Desulfacyla sp.]
MISSRKLFSLQVILVVACFLSFRPLLALTEPTLEVTQGVEQYPLKKYLGILEDRDGKWTIDDVSSPSFSRRFKPNTSENPSLGITLSPVWVRFRVSNDLPVDQRMYLQLDYPLMEAIELYTPTN